MTLNEFAKSKGWTGQDKLTDEEKAALPHRAQIAMELIWLGQAPKMKEIAEDPLELAAWRLASATIRGAVGQQQAPLPQQGQQQAIELEANPQTTRLTPQQFDAIKNQQDQERVNFEHQELLSEARKARSEILEERAQRKAIQQANLSARNGN